MTLEGMFCLVTVFALLVLVYVNTYGLSSFYSSKYTSTLRATPRPSFSTITKRTTARKNSTSLLKKTPCFSTITKREIARDPLKKYFLDQSLEQLYHFNSCAVVSSSHALKQHQYGAEIDKHDCVLRFGCAPTKTFERHVGSRTDIRLINTRVPHIFCKQEFWNDSIQMFNQEVVVVRHNNAYRIIGEKVNTAHDRYDSLPKYIDYINTHSDRQLFIQGQAFGPMVIRDLQEFCRKHTKCTWSNNNGASTGVFGVLMMVHLCNWVYVYEIAPSDKGLLEKYRYYYNETDLLGLKAHAHPYTAEHLYLTDLSLTSREDVRKTGVLLFRGAEQC
ncbi:beta-galactoside alpha-2,6-sialyltransferase 2-like [Branchiostoma lanceolatum]|uniref:beta-galactoside alpha-2,6-sialyltransferase 2-like n=1 Tax=Branchiostoma lanceolatum TaxID=7740 RepID=UPI003452D166